jgi:hypothetical protein
MKYPEWLPMCDYHIWDEARKVERERIINLLQNLGISGYGVSKGKSTMKRTLAKELLIKLILEDVKIPVK